MLTFPPAAASQSDPDVPEVVGELCPTGEEEQWDAGPQPGISVYASLPIQEAAASVPHQVEHRDESVELLLLQRGAVGTHDD